MSQVPVEERNVVTHATGTTHITYACSNFQRDRSTNDVTLGRDNCTLPPVSRLTAKGCWEKIHMWHSTSLLTDVNSISLYNRWIFVKIHARLAIHIRYIWHNFHCATSLNIIHTQQTYPLQANDPPNTHLCGPCLEQHISLQLSSPPNTTIQMSSSYR